MTAVLPPILQAFRQRLLPRRATALSVRSTTLLQSTALKCPGRSPISTITFRPGLQLSLKCRYVFGRCTATNHLYKQPLLFARQVSHAPPSKETTDVASGEKNDVGDASSLTKAQLNAIFRQEIDREGAAELLSQLQKQRRDGTLDEGLPYPAQMVDRGLEYLRSRYPIDEEAAIVARLDMELDGHWSLPQMNPEKSPTGRSALDEIRKINQAKRDRENEEMKFELEQLRLRKLKREKRSAEQAEKKLKRERALLSGGPRNRTLASKNKAEQPSGDSNLVGFSDAHQRRLERVDGWINNSNNRVAQLRAEATLAKLPQMTRWQRIWPSGVFTISIVGFALAFAHFYIPPSSNARLFPDVPPATAAVGAIIALNAFLFLMWRVPQAWKYMNRYFMVVPAVPRPFQMLGAEFSHQKWPHIAANMIPMWILGTQLHDDIGRGPFLALVLCGAVIPSFCSLVPHVMMKIMITASVGASGIITTFVGAACVLHEGRKITIFGLPPEFTSWINTGVILSLFVLWEVTNFWRFGLMSKALLTSSKPPIDFLGHLAGYATGIGAGCLVRQTSPYWGGLERRSFWKHKESTDRDAKVQDADTGTLKATQSLSTQIDSNNS